MNYLKSIMCILGATLGVTSLAYAKPSISQNEVLKIFEIAGFAGKEFEDHEGFSKKFSPKTQSVEHCVTFDNDEGQSCATTFIEEIKDINGDKNPEILVIDQAHGSYHYGVTEQAFAVLTKTKTSYSLIAHGMGIPTNFLKTKGKHGYPDLKIVAPGICFAVLRYNGKDYQQHYIRKYGSHSC